MSIMIKVNGFDDLVAARMLEFFRPTRGSTWQRRIWSVGSVSLLKEVIEAAEALQSSVFSEGAVRFLQASASEQTGPDPGLGGRTQRTLITGLLKQDVRFGGAAHIELEMHVPVLEREYLSNWRDALAAGTVTLGVEHSSRLIAGHLLGLGFSRSYLNQWLEGLLHSDPKFHTLADILAAGDTLARSEPPTFEIVVVFEKAPRSRKRPMPPEWLDGGQVKRWLIDQGQWRSDLRVSGGLLLSVRARDVESAIDRAINASERLETRVLLGTRSELRLHQNLWVRGQKSGFRIARYRRGVDVKSLDRNHQLYGVSSDSAIDSALQLVGIMDSGPLAPAAAAGWASIESLLTGPGDKTRSEVARRAGEILTCSFPRAELTQLSHAHKKNATDLLAEEIRKAPTNAERARLTAAAIRGGKSLELATRSDKLAEARIRAIVAAPDVVLRRVCRYMTAAMQRLYRQRNLVMHGARVDAVCLEPAVAMCAPLVGAVLDRLAHAQFVDSRPPLHVAAQAHTSLSLLGSGRPSEIANLLD